MVERERQTDRETEIHSKRHKLKNNKKRVRERKKERVRATRGGKREGRERGEFNGTDKTALISQYLILWLNKQIITNLRLGLNVDPYLPKFHLSRQNPGRVFQL